MWDRDRERHNECRCNVALFLVESKDGRHHYAALGSTAKIRAARLLGSVERQKPKRQHPQLSPNFTFSHRLRAPGFFWCNMRPRALVGTNPYFQQTEAAGRRACQPLKMQRSNGLILKFPHISLICASGFKLQAPPPKPRRTGSGRLSGGDARTNASSSLV